MSETGNIERQLREQGFYVSTTVGWSMFPMLRNRHDRIIVLPKGEERLKKYDLPLYRRPDGKYILHRIIGVKEDHYVIRGDNTYVKEHVPEDWILGYVSEFYRNDKHFLCSGKGYRVYAAMWNFIFPFRWCFWMFRRCLGKIKRLTIRLISGKKRGKESPDQ